MAVVGDMMIFPTKTHRHHEQFIYERYSEASEGTVDSGVDNKFNSRQSTMASFCTDEERRARVIDIVSATVSSFEERASLMVADESENCFAAVSLAFAAMIGCESRELVGNSCRWISDGTQSDPDELLRLRKALTLGDSCSVRLVNNKKTGELFVNLFHLRRVIVGANAEAQVAFWVAAHEDATGAETCKDLERIVATAEQSADKLCNMIDEAVQSACQHEKVYTLSNDSDFSDGYPTESEIDGPMDVRGNIDEDCHLSVRTKWTAVLIAGIAVGAAARCLK
eukprot:TRINITY_DN58217_c0_g1_i1.p1 TRINITY_DN58217_c0_g1~~TRINITY_DN58217_c0_g1_i1.p1  ORF type:complete len:305 (+),score=62.26 TRINITY_DN58217_c0_g1_i1:72-917(+)